MKAWHPNVLKRTKFLCKVPYQMPSHSAWHAYRNLFFAWRPLPPQLIKAFYLLCSEVPFLLLYDLTWYPYGILTCYVIATHLKLITRKETTVTCQFWWGYAALEFKDKPAELQKTCHFLYLEQIFLKQQLVPLPTVLRAFINAPTFKRI